MALAPAVVEPGGLERLRRAMGTTPGRIAAGVCAIALATLIALLVNLAVASRTSEAVQSLGHDAEPSVVLALRIQAVLGDLDATAAEDMLSSGPSAAGTSERWRQDKASLDDLAVQASRNITYSAEQVALVGLLRWTGAYQASLADVRGVAALPWTAAQRMLWAHRLVRDFALPQAQALADANSAPLLGAYGAYEASALPEAAAAAATLAVLLALLVILQAFLTHRTHRLINLPLAAATLIAIVLLGGVVIGSLVEREDVRAAKADCYDSLHALFAARADATAINADVLLWMLDAGTRPESLAAFDAGSRSLLDMDLRDPSVTSPYLDGLDHASQLERSGAAGRAARATPPGHGLLADEMGNITFGTAERDPATQAIHDLIRVVQVSDHVRQLDADGQTIEATELREHDGDAAFQALDDSISATIAINQKEFDRHIASARLLLGWTPVSVCTDLALCFLAAAAGLWQRYAEYR